jgi:multidrug efflux system membrane fusion protein
MSVRRLLCFVVSVVGLSMILAACGKEESSAELKDVVRPVKVVVLKGTAGAKQRQFPGKVQAGERVDLSFRVSGTLKELSIKEGQKVNKGASIGRLDQSDFRSTRNAAQAEYDKSKANFARAEQLIDKGHISKSDYDKLKAKQDVSLADLEKTRKALSDTILHAPFAGVIAKQFVQNFQDVQAKQPIVSLQDTNDLEVVVDVPERLVAMKSDRGDVELIAIFDAVPDRQFALKIKEFSTEADPNTQTFRYVLSMPQPEGINVLPGMSVTVQATQPEGLDAAAKAIEFALPAVAVAADDAGNPYVWVVDQSNKTVHQRKVVLGQLTGSDSLRITQGLAAGEMVAVSAVSRLRAGMTIRPVDRIEF